MNNAFDNFISRLDMSDERISELEDNQQKFPQLKCKEEKKNRKQNMQELQDNYNKCNILAIGILEGDRKK